MTVSSLVVELPYHIVDAFTDPKSTPPARGNPAAVFLLEARLTDDQMITAGILMQQPMTCFILPLPQSTEEEMHAEVRWITATGGEAHLCGHGSIASSVLLSSLNPSLKKIHYHTRTCGIVPSTVISPLYVDITFPLHEPPKPLSTTERASLIALLLRAVPDSTEADFGVTSRGQHDLIVEWVNPTQSLSTLEVDTHVMMDIETRATCFVSPPPKAAAGQEQPDFCVRVYNPRACIPAEDQVCGSAHSDILPHFLATLPPKAEGDEYVSHQVSTRGGRLGLVPLAGGTLVSLRGRGVVQKEKAGTIEI